MEIQLKKRKENSRGEKEVHKLQLKKANITRTVIKF